jgi:hypothetical protein
MYNYIVLFKGLKTILSISNLVDALARRFSFANISANSKLKSERLEM